MIRRLLVLCAILGGLALPVSAIDNAEKVTLSVGALKVIDLPFALQNYRPSTRGVVRIENFSDRQLRLIGEQQGLCELEVSGGGLTRIYSIHVVDNISELVKQLQTDLDTLPELDISINQDYIVIRGEVSRIESWEHLLRVLEIPKFKGCCQNYAKFRPAPEIMLQLKQILEKSGFTVVSNATPYAAGEIAMNYVSGVLSISGKVYRPQDVATIKSILATQPWLAVVEEKGATQGSQSKVQALVSLEVEPTTVWVDIVFIALSRQNVDKIGGGTGPTLTSSFSSFYDLIAGRGTGNTAMIGGDLQSTIQFLAANGVTRFHDAGCVVLKSNAPEGATQHIGGTKYVKVSGVENGSLQNIEYGLKITVKGGLIAKDRTSLEFDLKNNGLISVGEDGSYDQTTEEVKNSVVCNLDQTVVLGGYKRIVQNTTKAGLPILRNTPVLKWFVSTDTDSQEAFDLLVLACPRFPTTNRVPLKMPVVEDVTPSALDAQKDNNVRIEEEKRANGKSWLNWFSW